MNFKKLLLFTLLLIAVSSTITVLTAEDVSTSKTLVNNDLTMNGLHFKIPDGYQEVDVDSDTSKTGDKEDIDGTVVDAKVSDDFKNSAGDKIDITVGVKSDNKKIDSINPAGFEKKNIAGKDGFLKKEVDDGKDKYKFEYLQDGKLVKIEAKGEDVISSIIA